MATVVNQNTKMISITRGDTAFIGIKPKYRDTKEPYQFEAGDVVAFRFVKGDIYFEKRCEIDTVQNKCILTLSPEDTIGLPFDVYTYEIELIPMTGGRFTFIAQKMFNITFEVEKHIMTAITETSYVPASNQATANNTLLTAELHAMDVLDGDIDRTNGSVVEVVRKTTAEWVMFENNVSKDGEIYVYTDYRVVEGVDLSATKIGDGTTTIGELPFATLPITEDDITAWNGKAEVSDIPTELSQLTEDTGHRTVSDAEKETWNAAVQDPDYVHTDNNYDNTAKNIVDGVTGALADKVDKETGKGLSTNDYTDTEKTKLTGIAAGAEVNVQSDWNESSTLSDAYINNKPTKVSDFTNDAGFITKTVSDLTNYYDKTEVDGKIASVYKPSGNKTAAELLPALLVSANLGNVYNITTEGTTTADFAEGAGKPIHIGDNVAIVDINGTLKFDILAGTIDLSGYQTKVMTNPVTIGGTSETTVEGAINGLNTAKVDKEANKGLSTNDYSTTEKNKLAGIAEGAEVNVQSDWNQSDTAADDYIKNKPENLVQDASYVHTDNNYTTTEKDKLDGISENANKTGVSSVNGHLEIDDEDVTVYDDTEIKNALSTDTTEVEGNPLNFSTLSAQTAESTIVDLEPIQDLHGYDKPWVGGAGKNLCPLNEINATSNNVEITTLYDINGNILGYNLNGTASAEIVRYINNQVEIESNVYYFTTGLTTEITGFQIVVAPVYYSVKTSATFTTSVSAMYINIKQGTVLNNVKIYPMICLNSETDKSFAPYSNICPISGRTEIGILGVGKNICNPNALYEIFDLTGSGVYRYGQSFAGNRTYTIINNDSNADNLYYRTPKADLSNRGESSVKVNPNSYAIVTVASDEILWLFTEEVVQWNSWVSNFAVIIGNDTIFEPYTESNDLTISLGQTVYGGTLDLEKGILTVDKAIVDLGDLSWTDRISSGNRIFAALPDAKKWLASETPNAVCSAYPVVSRNNLGSSSSDNVCSIHSEDGTSNSSVNVKNKSYASFADFKDSLDGVKLCYELDSYITIQLTPNEISLLEGVNNISTDGDKITLTYRSGEVATLGDLTKVVEDTDSKIANAQILTDTETGYKYKLVVSNGTLSIEQISN